MNKISILLADDHAVVRQGLRALLAAEPDFDVVGEAENGREAVQMAQRLRPNVIVMDLAMPLLNGMEATRQIVREKLPSKLIILSSYSDEEYVRELLEAGTCGYLVKQTAASDLIKAVREVAKGKVFFSPSISKRMLACYQLVNRQGRPMRKFAVKLTSRQQEILQLIAEGHANKQMADVLGISIKTVEKHRQHLMDKLNLHEIAGLTRYAMSHGLVEKKERLASAPVNVPELETQSMAPA